MENDLFVLVRFIQQNIYIYSLLCCLKYDVISQIDLGFNVAIFIDAKKEDREKENKKARSKWECKQQKKDNKCSAFEFHQRLMMAAGQAWNYIFV